MTTISEFKNRIEALNQPLFQFDQNEETKIGWEEISDFIGRLVLDSINDTKKTICTIALDGYVGTDWSIPIDQLKESFQKRQISSIFLNVENSLKPEVRTFKIVTNLIESDRNSVKSAFSGSGTIYS